MKARIENNKIVFYNKIPRKLENSIQGTILGGYDKLPTEVHQADGFFDVIEPEYDPILQEINNIYFDEENNYFTYQVIDKVFDIEVIRNNKILELKQFANEEFAKTDWYYIRKLRKNIDIPVEIEIQSNDLYLMVDQIENEINNIDNIRDLLTYEINFNL